LDALCASLNDEAQLTPQAVAAKRLGLIRVLCNRLLLQDAFNRQPQIAEQVLGKAIVILGLPRSGTTKLHRMMAADPTVQKLPLWKLLYPVRALTPGDGSDEQRRVHATELFVNAIRENNPAMYAGHPMAATEPDEEYFGMELSFQAHINTSSFHAPSYEQYLDREDFANWYAWLRRFLQYQQFVDGGISRPWILKAPHHLGYLPLLFRCLPETTVVHCHRDPQTTVASFCALIGAARQGSSIHYRSEEVGRYILRVYRKRMQLYLQDRAALESTHRFVDLDYRRILKDATQVIEQCYRAAGIALTAQGLAAMQAWESANAQHKHGQHRYDSLEPYGITEQDVREAFGPYCERFAEFMQ
jgi:Sulfotransferase family